MSGQKDLERLVNDFVSYLNSKSLEPRTSEDIPDELRGPERPDLQGWFDWKISPSSANPWVGPLEEKLPRRFPAVFQILISRFRFCDFEVGPVMFYGNTGTEIFNELTRRVFADTNMSPALLRSGYLQFGQAAGGHYDPVCFAPRGLNSKNDSRIVRLDHEEILINNRIRVMSEIAPSLEAFIRQALQQEFEVH